MKTFKKICLGVGLAALFAVVFQLMPAGSALAAGGGPFNTSSDWTGASYTMDKNTTIVVRFPGGDHSPVNFIDSVPNDAIHSYVADTDGTGVCDGSTISFNSGQGFNNKPKINAQINVNYQAGPTPTCTAGAHNGANSNYSHSIQITNNTSGGGQKAADNGPAAITYDGHTYHQTQASPRAYGLSADIGTDCYGGSLIILSQIDSAANAPVKATVLPTSLSSAGTELSGQVSNFPSIPLSVATLGKCYYASNSDSGNHVILSVKSDGTAAFSGCSKGGSDCKPSAEAAQKTPPADPSDSCEANFNSPFGWIVCPAFGIADDIAADFNGFVQNQLCFKTTNDPISSTGNSMECKKGNNNLDSGVHNAWNIFKNLASALIVIALLIMIISQAIGGGPFDAYTVRKMLPKLVAAVILMQISWYLLKWAIDLSNDAGAAISNLIMAPFGGDSNLTLDHLINLNLGTHVQVTNDTFAVFAALAAGVGLLALSIPGLALMGLYVVMALFTAFVVLIFRKLLIIMLVILAPLAFVAWVMPGTERYWNMWRVNFTKLILMFPMIMALLAAGKIFASITAGATSAIILPHPAAAHLLSFPVPYFGSVTNFVNFAIIVGAYFGPYFFLPQTFKWGGAAMGAIAKGVNQAVEKGSQPAKKYLNWRKELTPWAQARNARKAEVERNAKLGFARRLGSDNIMGSVRRARLGGVPAPTPGGLRRERELRASITDSAEAKLREEEIKEEGVKLANEVDNTRPGATGLRYSEMARSDKLNFLEHEATHTDNEYKRQALLQQIAQLRGGEHLMRVRNHMLTHNQGAEWNRAVTRNFDDFNSTSAMFTQQADGAMMSVTNAQGQRAGRTFTPAEDMEYMGSQNDQTIASQSGSGWNLYHDAALAADNGMTIEQVAQARSAGTPLPPQGAHYAEAVGTYQQIMTSGQPYAGGVNPNARSRFGSPNTTSPAETWYQTATDADINNLVNNLPNGWMDMDAGHLRSIVNFRQGPLRNAAEAELIRRGQPLP